jgi:hypothetical protein
MRMQSCRHIDALFAEFAGGVTGADTATLDSADSTPSPTLNELPLLHQGDTVRHTRVFHSNATEKGRQVTPNEVEEKMLQLLLLPGVKRYLMPVSPAFSEDDVGRQRTAMAAHCKEGVTVAQLQRYNMLERMVDMLPSNAQVRAACIHLAKRIWLALMIAPFERVTNVLRGAATAVSWHSSNAHWNAATWRIYRSPRSRRSSPRLKRTIPRCTPLTTRWRTRSWWLSLRLSRHRRPGRFPSAFVSPLHAPVPFPERGSS